jgi:hypothetical protein
MAANSSLRGLVMALSASETLSTTERLTVVNGCNNEPIWIASSSNVPGQRSLKLGPGQRHTYDIPQDLHSTRFWPKLGCNSEGQECKIGDSGGPGQQCTSGGCAPPVDSKFEASFGHQGGNCKTNANDCDWWDTSAVDGFTIPYKVEISEECKSNGYKGEDIDCSDLTLPECPANEPINGEGNVDLRVHSPTTGETVGCYSPCGVLSFANWHNKHGGHNPSDTTAAPYCCPTPPVSSASCRAGPAPKTQYSNLIHKKCPSVYSYAYDDAIGLQVCPPETKYTWTLFCPGSDPGPAPAPPSPPAPAWVPCSASSAACCNPNTSPKQYCPGHIECQQCGGGNSCECHSGFRGMIV